MKRAVYYIRNSLFLATTLFFILSFSNILTANINSVEPINLFPVFLQFVLSLIFVGYLCIEFTLNLKTKENLVFNGLFIFISIIMMIIYARTYFDTNMVVVYLSKLTDPSYRGMNTLFLIDNMKYFDIFYIMLFIYGITVQGKEAEQKKK